jgi:hypothetical protein
MGLLLPSLTHFAGCSSELPACQPVSEWKAGHLVLKPVDLCSDVLQPQLPTSMHAHVNVADICA